MEHPRTKWRLIAGKFMEIYWCSIIYHCYVWLREAKSHWISHEVYIYIWFYIYIYIWYYMIINYNSIVSPVEFHIISPWSHRIPAPSSHWGAQTQSPPTWRLKGTNKWSTKNGPKFSVSEIQWPIMMIYDDKWYILIHDIWFMMKLIFDPNYDDIWWYIWSSHGFVGCIPLWKEKPLWNAFCLRDQRNDGLRIWKVVLCGTGTYHLSSSRRGS